MKIGQWNVRTVFETGKCAQVIKEMQRYGISILRVSEMRWNSCGKIRVATGETVLYPGMDEGGNHEKGVGFILSKEDAQCLLEWEPVSERIIRARFNSRWQQVTILQRYAPTNEATEEANDDFYDQLQMVLEQVPCPVNIYAPNKDKESVQFFRKLHTLLQIENLDSEENIILGGDFNCPLNPNLDKRGGIMIPRKSVVNSIECVQNELDLVDIWRVKNPETRSYTWSQKSPTILCRLDFWLISNNV